MKFLWLLVAAFIICWSIKVRVTLFATRDEFNRWQHIFIELVTILMCTGGLAIAVHLG